MASFSSFLGSLGLNARTTGMESRPKRKRSANWPYSSRKGLSALVSVLAVGILVIVGAASLTAYVAPGLGNPRTTMTTYLTSTADRTVTNVFNTTSTATSTATVTSTTDLVVTSTSSLVVTSTSVSTSFTTTTATVNTTVTEINIVTYTTTVTVTS